MDGFLFGEQVEEKVLRQQEAEKHTEETMSLRGARWKNNESKENGKQKNNKHWRRKVKGLNQDKNIKMEKLRETYDEW